MTSSEGARFHVPTAEGRSACIEVLDVPNGSGTVLLEVTVRDFAA